MAPPAGITAFNVRITEPELLDNYSNFLRGVKKGGKPLLGGKATRKISQTALEQSIGKFYKATVRGGSARLVPDFEINAEEISSPLAAALGLEEITETELKATRGER